jgi:putative molybdopterin biosynthesis protein
VADAGLGFDAAARSFGLDFVPLVGERHCFVCLKPALEDPAVQALQRVLASEAWNRELTGRAG